MDSVFIDVENENFSRTAGDGMEEKVLEKVTNSSTKTEQPSAIKTTTTLVRQHSKRRDSEHQESGRKISGNGTPLPGLHTLYRRTEAVTRSIAPVLPKGELVPLKPRLIGQINSLPEHKKIKPPKFVPYEPYPGAVNPIEETIKHTSGHTAALGLTNLIKKDKNNLDIGILVNQMSTMRTQELKDEANTIPTTTTSVDEINAEVLNLKEELKKTREERDYFQGQFKFQTQVNSELKNLLVASVGEDLQTRVNVLTEDKLQLARALLHTANNLSTHTEQIEFLAGQCEVWRSKFLASSVMVEELARWKADLTHRNEVLNVAVKDLLTSMQQLRDMQLETLRNLKFLAKIRYLNLPATDVFSLSAENLNIIQQMALHAGLHGIPEAQLNISSASTNTLCKAEQCAEQALERVSQPLMATDEAIRALFGQAQRPYGTVDITATSNNEDASQ